MSCGGGGCFSSGGGLTHSNSDVEPKAWEEMNGFEQTISTTVAFVVCLVMSGLVINGLVFLSNPGKYLNGGNAAPQAESSHLHEAQ